MDTKTASPIILRQLLAQREEALQKVRAVLTQECHTAGYSFFDKKDRMLKIIEEGLK